MTQAKEVLDRVVDVVLAYKPDKARKLKPRKKKRGKKGGHGK